VLWLTSEKAAFLGARALLVTYSQEQFSARQPGHRIFSSISVWLVVAWRHGGDPHDAGSSVAQQGR
jgi:hypothetical protein